MPGRWRQTTAAPTRIALEQRRGNGREVARRRRYTYQRGWFRIINVRLATRIACRQRQLTEAHLIKRALHPTADLQRVGVDHGGSHIRVAQQFLHGADVRAALQQSGGEGVAQRVRRYRFVDAGVEGRALERTLQALLEQMMAPRWPALRIRR